MPRIARKNLESSYHHVMVQGINQEFIFEGAELKESYKKLLRKNLADTNIKVLAYCIMDNHAHLLFYSEKSDELSKVMSKTNTSYARLYNKIKDRVGYVFRDRYYTQTILSREHLFNCVVYIHNNPIKGKIVEKVEDYLWSSYSEFLSNKDLITDKSIELIFESIDYREMFFQIHKRKNIEDIKDVKENRVDSKEIIESYLIRFNENIESLIENEEEFSELLFELRHYAGLSLRDMSKIFNINKDKLNRIINKKL